MRDYIDDDSVMLLLDKLFVAVEGENTYDAVAAASCLITELLSSHSTSHDMAMVLLNTATMTINVNIEQRIKQGRCSWQSTKQ
jgi:hypothetical protein